MMLFSPSLPRNCATCTSTVRVFTIAYGKQASFDQLKQIAQASNAAAYDASNPATISKVFTAVLSNF